MRILDCIFFKTKTSGSNAGMRWPDWRIPAAIVALIKLVPIADAAAVRDGAEFGLAENASDNTAAFTRIFELDSDATVKLPKGTYRIACPERSFTARRALSLVGQGVDMTTIRLAGSCVLRGSLFRWVNQEDFEIRDLSVDLNGTVIPAGRGSHHAVVDLVGDKNFSIQKISIYNSAACSGFLLISGIGISRFHIDQNRLKCGVPSPHLNQAVNISSEPRRSTDGTVSQNTAINTAFDIWGSHITIAANDISGWHFGAGITTAQGKDTSFAYEIVNNSIHDGYPGLDDNQTASEGIEHWGYDSKIAGNRIWNNGGNGISNGGANTLIKNNIAYDNGTFRRRGCGFSTIQAGRYSGEGSRYEGNVAYDTGTGVQLFGYCEPGAKITGLQFIGNRFQDRR